MTSVRSYQTLPRRPLSLAVTTKPPWWKRTLTWLRRLLSFIGPGYLIAVGYMDPGNWATDLAAGSQYGYAMLCVIFCSNIAALLLQVMAIKLGVVTGMDLARMCREQCPRYLNWILYLLCELAIIATDLAEVIGSAIALDLLFGLALPIGVSIMALDVLLLLLFYRPNGSLWQIRYFEWLVMAMVSTVGICFALELSYIHIPILEMLRGFLPSSTIFSSAESIYLALGIVGATVMPHNLYLHSFIVQARAFKPIDESIIVEEKPTMSTGGEDAVSADLHQSPASTLAPVRTADPTDRARRTGYDTARDIRTVIRLTAVDCILALTFALLVNAAILITGAGAFHGRRMEDGDDPADLYDAHRLLGQYLGAGAALLYAIALLVAGQSSTLTATLAGQIAMEGFLGLRLRPWLRRLITRLCAIVPALTVALISGRSGITKLLVISQVALSVQLPFAMVPLVWFTSSKRIMRPVGLAPTDDNDHDLPSPSTPRRVSTEEVAGHLTESSTTDAETETVASVEEALRSASPTPIDTPTEPIHFANSLPVMISGALLSAILVGLNIFMVVQVLREGA